MDEDRQIEAVKMYQDTLKHMTTFSSGALVLSATVVGALFPKPGALVVLGFAFISFLGGAAVSMVGLLNAPRHLAGNRSATELGIFLGVSVLASYIGVVLFTLVAVLNFTAGFSFNH